MYVLIIGVSIAGAFLFSLIFVALYYYLNMNPAIKGYKMDRAPTFESAPSKSKRSEKPSGMDKQQQQHDYEQHKLQKQAEESDIEVDLDSLKSFGR